VTSPLMQPTIVTDGGPWASHNMPCAVCHGNPAVLDVGSGTFAPCWFCQRQGWVLVNVRWARLRRWLAARAYPQATGGNA